MTGDNKDIAQNIYNLKDEFIAQGKTTLDILNDVLMPALQNISDKFANGELFLPQIIKSASVMKQAADCLELNKSNENSDVKQNYIGTILIATVKGDVHDIGKNIVAAVLECNGFKVIDLGIKVECEKIIDTAIKENVDAIALSGLISPSLEEMLNVVRELEKRKLSIPVIVGGATVTKKFVALRASPEYKSGFVVYAIDATQTSKIALELVSKNRDNFIKEIKFEYQQIYDCNDNNIHTQIETNFDYIASGYTPISPRNLGLIFINKNIKDIAEKIDWNTYYRAFRTNPNRENGDKQSEILKQDAFQIIEKLSEKNAKALGAVGIFPANSENDKIYIYNSFPKNIDTETSNQLDCLANIKTKKLDNRTTSIANFIAPKTSNIKDYIGLFALTFSSEVQEFIQEYKAEGNLYFAFGTELLVNALAETFSELLHREIAEKYWGYAGIKQQNIGIRPAPGYPALPDHSVKNTILSLLNAEMNIGITLTGNYAMLPTYSICGLYIAHPDAKM